MLTPEELAAVACRFDDIVDLDPLERAAAIARCDGWPAEMHRELESLLAAHDRAGSFLELPPQPLGPGRAESMVGRTAGPYTIVSPLGAGSMGDVYLAHDPRLGRKVALKLLPPYFTKHPDRLRRFHREAIATSSLNHPNILTIYEIGHDDATHYIATEHIEGVTLRELMAREPLTIAGALDAALQVGSALSAAHAAGIVHRDIKPENIMRRSDGYYKVLDFGLAKLAENRERPPPNDLDVSKWMLERTEPGTVMGTVKYMSPEQARGFDVDAGADIWSLGVVLYEMVAGCVPFAGSTSADTLVAILEREAPPLTRRAGDVPPELGQIVRRMLQKIPGERYGTVDEVRRDLAGLKRELDFAAQLRRSAGDDPGVADSLLPVAMPPRHAGSRAVNNLSTQIGTIVGRDVELAGVAELLRDDEVRLVTLTGAGGTGKTRLGQQVARDVLDEFAEGVFFVPLAPLNSHALVAAAIAQTVGVQETRGRGFAEGLTHYLRDRQMLLVLDNFEHVTAAAPLVVELLAACRQLKVLVTSRAALHVSGERELRVPPLALPASDVTHTAASVLQCAAAELFVHRVRAARPQFTVTDDNAQTIAEICLCLDGLPFALELAAARTKLLSLEEILARMDQRLKLLTGGARDLPGRQQTMRATIAWSFDLLNEDKKTLCRRVSVFFGGCTLGQAEAVCTAVGGVAIDVLDGLESLVDEGLVLKKERGDGGYRFFMLETMREFGLEQLEASGEGEAIRHTHADFFLRFAEDVESQLMSAGREAWLSRLDSEHNNLRAALRWSLENGHAETGLRLVGALRWFWYHRGHIGEGFHWADKLLALSAPPTSARSRANALFCAGSLAFYYSEPAAACPLLRESIALWRDLGDTRSLAYALTFTSLPTLISELDFHSARATAEESVALFRALDDPWGLALSLNYAGVVLWTEPGLEQYAIGLLEESAELFGRLGDGWGRGGPLLYLAAIRQEQGHLEAALSLYEEFLVLTRESKDVWRLASGLDILSQLVRSQGDEARADALSEESATLQRKLGRSLNMRKAWEHMKRRHPPVPS